MHVRFTKRAAHQLDGILSDLSKINPKAAKTFSRRIASMAERIGQFPDGYQKVGERPACAEFQWSAIRT